MEPYPNKLTQDDETVDSDSEDTPQKRSSFTTKTKKGRNLTKTKKRRNLTLVSKKYDLDGDGVLDEIEQAMRDKDVSNRGFLTNNEIHTIVQEQLKAKKSAGHMKRLVSGLICFVVLLALANLGTSLASAVLAKDLAADGGGDATENPDGTTTKPVPTMKIVKTGAIAAAQSVADTYDVSEMTDQQLDSRRRLVLAEMDEDVHSHTHRVLKKVKAGCKMGRSRDSDCVQTSISFDSSVMDEKDFSMIESKCQMNMNVNIRRKWGDGTDKNSRNECICQRGTSVVVKEKGKRSGRNMKDMMEGNGGRNKGKNKNKGKNNRDREVIIESPDGSVMHVDCVDGECFIGGEILQGNEGDDCTLKANECRSNFVCAKSSNKKKGLRTSSKYGTCQYPTLNLDGMMIRNAKPRELCSVNSEWDACTNGYYCKEQVKRSGVGLCTSVIGLGQNCKSDFQCGRSGNDNNYCDGVCTRFRSGGDARTRTNVIQLKADEDELCDVSYGKQACRKNYVCSGPRGESLGRVGTGTCQTTMVDFGNVNIRQRAGDGQVCLSDYKANACASNYVCLSNKGMTLRSGATGFCRQGSYNQIYNNQGREGGNGRAGAGMECFGSNGANACISTHVCLGPNMITVGNGATGFCQWGDYNTYYGRSDGGGCNGPNYNHGDCTYDRCCNGGYSCRADNMNGSDRWWCG